MRSIMVQTLYIQVLHDTDMWGRHNGDTGPQILEKPTNCGT